MEREITEAFSLRQSPGGLTGLRNMLGILKQALEVHAESRASQDNRQGVCVCVWWFVCVVSISIYAILGEWFSSTSNGHYTPGTGTIILQYSFISYLFCSLRPTFYLSLLLYLLLSLSISFPLTPLSSFSLSISLPAFFP